MEELIIDYAGLDNLDVLQLSKDDPCYFGKSMARKMLLALSIGWQCDSIP